MKDNINLILACDDNFAQHACIAIMSAYENCSCPARLRCFILDGGVTATKKATMQASVKQYNAKIEFIQVDSAKFSHLYASYQYTAAIYYRLDLPNLMPKSIAKCLYVDCDILFVDDIVELWDVDLQGQAVAAIEDIGLTSSKKGFRAKQDSLGLSSTSLYFNSGVVIMDLEQWRRHDYARQAIDLAVNNDFVSHDQDVLNKLFLDKWQPLDYRWNVMPPITYLYPKIVLSGRYRQKAVLARKNPGIIHFAGRYKPWEFKRIQGFNDYYYEVLSKSAFAQVTMPQLSRQNVGKNIEKEILRLRIAEFLAGLL